MQRGKVDVFISYEDLSQTNVVLQYQKEIAAQYMNYFRMMEEQFGILNDVTTTSLGRCPEVFTMEESTADEKELWSILEKALRVAAEQFAAARQQEGIALRSDLYSKLEGMIE